MEVKKHINFDNISLVYAVYGEGNKTIITLHGFGRDYQDFKFFENELKGYKVIGINLFFHGGSIYPKSNIPKQPLSKETWFKLFETLLQNEKISSFNLLSYSMGGKFAFCLLERFYSRINKAVFLAPDGIVINPWYKLMINTQTGKVLSKWFGRSSFGIPQMLKITTTLKVTKPTLKRFVEHNISSKEKREKIYWVWQTFREIKPNHEIIAKNLSKVDTEVFVFLGKFDVAIKDIYQKRLTHFYGDRVNVKVLPLGHNLFKELLKPEFQKIWQ